MSSEVTVAVITIVGSLLVAAVSYHFSKRKQIEAEWRTEKLNHYKVLLASISDLAVDNEDIEAHRHFALPVNTLALVAPQYVVKAMLAFHDGVKISAENRSPEVHDELLSKLLLAIRKDLGMKPKDDIATFQYHLIGAPHRRKNRS